MEPGGRRVRELIRRPAAVVFEDCSLREAADHMVREGVGRLPVVRRDAPARVVGMITRSDLLGAHQRRLDDAFRREQGIGGTRTPPGPRAPSPA
jgi:predicted transcriptional regulator